MAIVECPERTADMKDSCIKTFSGFRTWMPFGGHRAPVSTMSANMSPQVLERCIICNGIETKRL